MPSPANFAECQKSGTRRSHSLPSVGPCGTRQSLALGKEWLCRVPQSSRHSAKGLFAECNTRQRVALDKKWHLTAEPAHAVNFFKKNLTAWAGSAVKCHFFCRVPGTLWHSAKLLFAECQTLPSATRSGTRQRVASPSARFLALGKSVFSRSVYFSVFSYQKIMTGIQFQ